MLQPFLRLEPSVLGISNRSWPPNRFRVDGAVSVRAMATALDASGDALEAWSRTPNSAWSKLSHEIVTTDVVKRVLNPAIMHQELTQFCGPISIVFELARRAPERYVDMCRQLFETGSYVTPGGQRIQTTRGLRQRRVPARDDDGNPMAQADWLATASMRDDENWLVPITDGSSWTEGLTTFGEMARWTGDVLGLSWHWHSTFANGEASAMRAAAAAVAAGGVAFLCVDVNVIRPGDARDAMGFRRLQIDEAGESLLKLGPFQRSEEDRGILGLFPDHWVVLLGGVRMPPGADDDSEGEFEAQLWSWASRFFMGGTVEGFSEYMYGIVIGR